MDRKKKNGANVSDDHDGKSERDSRPGPTHTVSGDGDRARASTSASSDKDSNKAHSHAPDDANKQGPQKKRRKVTHGTALPFPAAQPHSLSPELLPSLLSHANSCVSAFLQLAYIAVDL